MTDQIPDSVDTDAPTDPNALRPSQMRRVAALGAAREALVNRQMFGTSVNSWTTGDLLAVADWIVDGSEAVSCPVPAFLSFLGAVKAGAEGAEPDEDEPEAAPEPTTQDL